MKILTRNLALLLLLVFFASRIQAQMRYEIDSTSIAIGDQTTLTIGHTDVYPAAEQLSQNGLVVIRQWFDTTEYEGGRGIVQRTVLTCFDAGEHWLRLGENDSISLIVRDVPNVDTASLEIKDINGTLTEPYTFWEIFRWILLALGVALLIAAIIYAIRRYKEHKPLLQLPKAPPTPPHEIALKELNELRVKQLWQQGKLKEYHTQLTDTLRNYIEASFGIRATDMTTDETLEAFSHTAVYTPENETLLQSILTTADMVKFAKSEPLPYEHDRSMSNAVAFVEQTHTPTSEETTENKSNEKQ
ncbi:MAG: hypothetical protein IJ764_07115 [Bacteroidales bacterium]|nr:hypothetical protein [Bacteroidales bacterium]